LAKYYSLVSWLHLSILLDTSDTSNTFDTSSIRNTDAGSPYFAILTFILLAWAYQLLPTA